MIMATHNYKLIAEKDYRIIELKNPIIEVKNPVIGLNNVKLSFVLI